MVYNRVTCFPYICPRYTLTALLITLGNVESIMSAFCSMQMTFCCWRQLRLCRKLVLACEGEIRWLDMSINVKKSACMRIGPRFSATCPNINTIDGSPISWCNNIRYPGVYLKTHRVFRRCYDRAIRSFYKAFNSIFGKVGSVTSEEVITQLLKVTLYLFYIMTWT